MPHRQDILRLFLENNDPEQIQQFLDSDANFLGDVEDRQREREEDQELQELIRQNEI